MRGWLRHVREFEPARWRTIVGAALALAAALGVHFDPSILPPWVDPVLAGLVAVIAGLQGELTRRNVYSKGAVELRLGHDVDGANTRTL